MQFNRCTRLRSVALVTTLLVSGLLLANLPAAAEASRWVRTRDGWEREETLRPQRTVYEPALHPLIVTTLVSLGSLMALIAFPARPKV